METLQRDWGSLAFEDRGGSGPCLLFLHGSHCDSSDWQETLEHLPGGLRLITMDFRGHGQSSVPEEPFVLGDLAQDARDLLKARGVSRAMLVGHSLGGMVALQAARDSSVAACVVLLEGWTRLSCSAAFSRGRFYGRLTRKQIQRIQNKRLITSDRFHPLVWDHFWTSVMRFDGTDSLQSAAQPIYQV